MRLAWSLAAETHGPQRAGMVSVARRATRLLHTYSCNGIAATRIALPLRWLPTDRGSTTMQAFVRRLRNRGCLAMVAALALATGVARAGDDGPLHVPSPDWRDQVIYFAMIDRFDDGDPRNNDQGAGEYDPADGARYSGGDLAGLARRIDYVRGLGATALWITPPVANQWWDPQVRYGGYHGYWAENFVEVDAHVGTLADLQRLSRRLHAQGMFLVQDIVVNHVGNFFSWPGRFDARAPQRDLRRNRDARPHAKPTQVPFSLNDVRDPAQRAAAVYHWTPAIRDFADPVQQRDWQLADLDDLNTENPRVRAALRQSYAHWIREAGVDAFRVDTAFYVPPAFFDDFLHADDAQAPGILAVARASGRAGFHVFGEGFGIDRPFEDREARRIDSYQRDTRGNALLPGMLNFPLYGSLLDVFARGRPSAVLGHRIRSMMAVHANPHLMPSFVDNHDVDRFLAGADERALKQALLAIMTLPGIPVIYYGTEQGFTAQRAAMFAGGHGADGRDHFDTGAPLYRYLQQVVAMRRTHQVFSRGTPSVLDTNWAAPGVLAYAMRDGATTALVVFNTATHDALLADVDSTLVPGTRLRPLLAIDGDDAALRIDARGRMTARLPARSGQVFLADGHEAASVVGDVALAINELDPAPVRGDLVIEGSAHGVHALDVVVDGDLARARRVDIDAQGRWRAVLDTADFIDPAVVHRVVAWSPQHAVTSSAREFRVARTWRLAADVADARGDDRGPRGRYRPITDPGARDRHPLDLLRVRAWTSGGALRVELEFADVLAQWNPPNGFDHVAPTLFVSLPGRDDGARVMPLQNADLPDDLRWHVRVRAGGWASAIFSADGASTTREGTPIAAALDIAADLPRKTLTLTLPAAALGSLPSLDGARLHVVTWDYDGGYRPLARRPAAFTFGGGDGSRDPLVMDSSGVIELR
jgi:glycosidase